MNKSAKFAIYASNSNHNFENGLGIMLPVQFLLRVPRPDGEVDVREGLREVPRPEEARGAVGERQRQRGRRVPSDEVIPVLFEAVKVDFGYSTSRKLVVEDVVNSSQKMAEEALSPVK